MVTETRATIRTQLNSGASETADDATRGWYLYGITRRLPLAALLAEEPDGSLFGADAIAANDDAAPLQLLEYSGLVAVVRPVLLADFSPTVVQERLRSAAELEAMVRSHHRVIEGIHAQQPILPAKFGMVYTHARDIVSALRSTHETLLRELDRLDGCDEWAVHVYADRAAVRERVSTADGAIRRLQQESVAARPGRAYFLERQLRDEVEATTQSALVTLAQETLDRLKDCAVAAQLSPVPPGDPAGEVEILRAAFLVTREGAKHFMEEMQSGIAAGDGLRCEWSGPWPPYSFAAGDNEEAE